MNVAGTRGPCDVGYHDPTRAQCEARTAAKRISSFLRPILILLTPYHLTVSEQTYRSSHQALRPYTLLECFPYIPLYQQHARIRLRST